MANKTSPDILQSIKISYITSVCKKPIYKFPRLKIAKNKFLSILHTHEKAYLNFNIKTNSDHLPNK